MTKPKPPTEPTTRDISDAIHALLDEARPAIGDLREASRRTNRIVRLALIGLLLDLLLSVGLAVNAVRTERALSEAQRGQIAALVACKSTNEVRAAELKLWLPILARPNPKATAEDKQKAAEFEASLRRDFAEKDCSKVAR